MNHTAMNLTMKFKSSCEGSNLTSYCCNKKRVDELKCSQKSHKKVFSTISYIPIVFLIIILAYSTQGSLALRRSKSDKESNGQNCTNHLQIIDRCSSMATYSYTATLNPYPQTMNEMKTSCDRIGEGIRCLKVHVRCLHSLSRRSLNAYTTARSRHSRRLCANMNDQKVTEFIKASDCVRQKGKLASMVGDEKELISNLQSLAVNSTMKWDDRFHRACCAASKYKNQVLIHLEPQCNQYKTITEDMLNSMVGELLEAACPDDRRLVEICAKQPVFKVPDSWQGGSLTRAALDVITILAETSDKDDKRD